jgi:D-amino-acid dehydrogenase
MGRKTVVIGAGVAGLMAAYFLARRDREVVVLEKEGGPAEKCSKANGGQISVSNSETWNTWSNVRRGLAWMLKKDAPLLIRPEMDLDKAIWLLRFLYNTANGSQAKNTAATILMGLQSRRILRGVTDVEGIDYDQRCSGILHFYKNEDYFRGAIAARDVYETNGCEWKVLSPGQVRDLEPALNDVSGIIGGVYTSSDWTGDIHKFCRAMERVLIEKYSVEFIYGHDALPDADECKDIVIAAGADSPRLARRYGENLPIYPVKGYSITVHNVNDSAPKVSLLDDQAKIVTSALGDRLRVAGTAELAGHDYEIRRDRIEPLVSWVRTNFPSVDCSSYDSWACLRPMTPNMMPIVRRSAARDNVWYHTGHGHLGWTLSAGTALELSKMMS